MSISLEEARKKLDILEKLASDPSLILTELFSEGVSGSNFLYQVKVNNKYILDYLKDYLSELPVLSECKIAGNCGVFRIAVEPLRVGEYANYLSDDDIVKIDADERTYKILNKSIKTYENIMNKNYTLETKELSDYWKRFVDLTFKKRIFNSINSIKSKRKLLIRLQDFIFWYFVRNERISSALDREHEKINDTNDYNIKQYSEDTEKQRYYLQYAPGHINNIKRKQKNIEDYLLSIGYKEDNNMSDY